jgi:hypothetical protein
VFDIGEVRVVRLMEDKEPQTSKSDNSRVNTVNRDVGEVSISYKSCLVSSIVLDIINEMDSNLFEALDHGSSRSRQAEPFQDWWHQPIV